MSITTEDSRKSHIPPEELVGFLIGNRRLPERDAAHLARCDVCFRLMVDSTIDYFRGEGAVGTAAEEIEKAA